MNISCLKRVFGIKVIHVWVLFLSLSSCMDEAPRTTIPFAPVNFQIDLNGVDHPLKNPLSYKIFTEQDRRSRDDRFGYSGVFVVMNATGTALYVYDLCCPHEKKREITVTPEDNGTAACSLCGSKFVTMYEMVAVENGPSSEPLQKYHVIPVLNHPGTYRVTN